MNSRLPQLEAHVVVIKLSKIITDTFSVSGLNNAYPPCYGLFIVQYIL